jgi:hypothetical protein
MPSDPAKDQASIIFCRSFALFGRPSTVSPLAAHAPHAMSLGRVSIIGAKLPAADSATSLSIRCGSGALANTSCLLRCPHDNCRVNWNYSKIPNRNNVLQRNFNHIRVLFVQHPSEKGRSRVVRSGSFIACAEVLGNCDRATEGGIPRSSRFRWFA